jgi:hypothetical protein
MKTLITISSTAAALVAAASAGSFALDLPTLVAIAVSSGIVGMFAADYSKPVTYNLEPAKAPAARKQARTCDAGVEFASYAKSAEAADQATAPR